MTDQPAFLPTALYRAAEVRELDRQAIEVFGMPGGELMERAGRAACRILRETWPAARRIAIVCGSGNNGGDGFVLARYAHMDGLEVRLLASSAPERLRGDARAACEKFLAAGGALQPWNAAALEGAEVVVDALLGTGLDRPVADDLRSVIEAINGHPAPRLAIDIPSGLNADTGEIMGCAVQADVTVTFVGLKRGLFTGEGRRCSGAIHYHDLGVPQQIFGAVAPSAERVDLQALHHLLRPRPRSAHKGLFGHVLVVGGDHGYAGAVRMAGEAAARVGAGLVSIATRAQHLPAVVAARPELMVHAVEKATDLNVLLERATVVAIGPGLGQSKWSGAMLSRVLDARLPLVVDADALNLIARDPVRRADWILTPHPGEAARLLGCDSRAVQADRFAAAAQLESRYGGVIVLKGSGTIVTAEKGLPAVCSDGNPGMASGGMGDVLTGIIAGLLAQGIPLTAGARLGVALHAAAADCAAGRGERGLLASDLFRWIRRLANPHPDGAHRS